MLEMPWYRDLIEPPIDQHPLSGFYDQYDQRSPTSSEEDAEDAEVEELLGAEAEKVLKGEKLSRLWRDCGYPEAHEMHAHGLAIFRHWVIAKGFIGQTDDDDDDLWPRRVISGKAPPDWWHIVKPYEYKLWNSDGPDALRTYLDGIDKLVKRMC